MSRPQNSVGTQKKQLGPQKVKNDPKIKSKSNVRIEGSMPVENFGCQNHLNQNLGIFWA